MWMYVWSNNMWSKRNTVVKSYQLICFKDTVHSVCNTAMQDIGNIGFYGMGYYNNFEESASHRMNKF